MSLRDREFRVELENPHVKEQNQVWVGTVGQGPDGVRLCSDYNTRFREDYQASLGNAVGQWLTAALCKQYERVLIVVKHLEIYNVKFTLGSI